MDIIHLLPDSIANQIAAGEVIQRPSSAVKELIENAIDAGADTIQVLIKDAGRSLIQVIDNGKGMSETDARMAFERYATSKIQTAHDLFALRTLGFRGEALASIAAVAQVELKTRRKEDETGTLLQISGSKLEKQETIAVSAGSNFAVKNLFFNIPARRKFLKSNETEFKNLLTEFERVALVYPQIAFNLQHNGTEIFSLPASGLKQRIVYMMGKKIAQSLLPINIRTSYITISGFVGTPDSCKQRNASQYFFVNGRYMRHSYFHRAVMMAFDPFIPPGHQPNYFIYMEIDPASIDVNIHPTKTEIKFEDEPMLFQILSSAVKETIAVPDLVFDREEAIDMPVYTEDRKPVEPPKISLRPGYNPFREHAKHLPNWEQLYGGSNTAPDELPEAPLLPIDSQPALAVQEVLQFKDRYLLTSLKSGLAVIDQRRAHIRILFDDFFCRMSRQQGVSQKLIFPETIVFTPKEATILPCLLDDLAYIGFDLEDTGDNSCSINGIPAGLENADPVETLQAMIDKALETGCEVHEEVMEALALSLAQKAAIPYGKSLSDNETQALIARLFTASSPNYTPDGKIIVSIFSEEELGKRFK